MFLIPEFLVEDKNLGKVLQALSGLALELKAPRPVEGAKLSRGKVVAIKKGTDGYVSQVAEKLHEMHLKEVEAVRIRDIVNELGGNPTGYAYYIKRLVDTGILKRTKNRGVYGVHHKE